jgi:hypothetical protein
MKNLIKSLSNFQNECPVIHKDTKGHNYTYADLPQIFSVINPLLKKNGLCFSQLLENEGIRTILFHVESGESLESFTLIPKVKLGNMNDYQAYGSGVTYFRRYCLSSMLALVTDKDLDAAGTQVEAKIIKTESKPLQYYKTIIDSLDSIEGCMSFYNDYLADIQSNPNILPLLSTKKLSFTINQPIK